MLSKKLHEAINAQINAELWSAYLYLAMSMDAEAKGLKGVANWFYVQFKEENDHARIFMNYLNSRDAKVTLLPIEEVPTTWDSVLAMFTQTLEHEKKVTALINNLAAISNEDRDFASINRMVWFIDEQVEEEENAREMIAAVEAVDECVGKVVDAVMSKGGIVLITADHGNADYAVNEDGTPNTAHSLNDVPFIVVNAGDEVKEVKNGKLADVAPTILKLMGIEQPAAMTGQALV